MPIQVPIRNVNGEEVGQLDLDERVWGVKRNDTLIHQVVVAQQANKRVGTADTKTRGDMDWGGAKPYRQKGTGRARQGTKTAPHYKGGGVVWGPHPRDFRQATPRKMRRGALRSVLSTKVADGELIILDEIRFDAPKTKQMVSVLENLGVEKALIVLTDSCTNVRLSASNIPGIETTRADSLNVLDVISKRILIMPVEAVRLVEDNLRDDHQRMTARARSAGVPAALIRGAASANGAALATAPAVVAPAADLATPSAPVVAVETENVPVVPRAAIEQAEDRA